ncbi:PAS domain-containing protein [Hymenobacter sp. BT635]|uniref:histidine kinase n=1 Tax=Hymenobacter nitidus TaxID=2880929 RepID=A0ABS8AB81_9BACT|nr:PAS domain-containing protein [Hymenobacter nitidus]MCB2377151.1 PAS domain-containing protein [Hymenobacter nitidus]
MLAHPDYQALFEALPDVHLALTPELLVVAASAGAARIAGCPLAAMLGKPAADVFVAQAGPASALVAAQLRAALPPGQPRLEVYETTSGGWHHRAWSVLSPAGDLRYYMYRAAPQSTGSAGPAAAQPVPEQPRGEASGQPSSRAGTILNPGQQQEQQRLSDQGRHLQQILSQVPAHIATLLGPDHVYGFLNEKGNQLFGGKVQLGMPAALAVPELVTNGYIKLVDEIYRTGKPFELSEMPMVQPPAADGSVETLYFDGVLRPLTGEQGQTQGVLVFGIDVTERVLAKQRTAELMAEIREQDAQFRSMVEALPLFVYITDVEGNMLYINPQRYEYTGQGPDPEFRHWQQALHPDDRGRMLREFARGRELQQAWSGEFRLRRHDGAYRWQLLRAVPMLRPTDGAVIRWYGSSVDIDDQKQFQQQLEAKDEQLQRILNNLPAIINTMEGPEHRYAFMSEQFRQVLGGRGQLGDRVVDAQPEVAEQGFVRVLDEVYRTGEPYRANEQRVDVTNALSGRLETHYYNFSYQLLPPLEGQPDTRGILSFAVDVTEQVVTRQRAEALLTEIGRSNERLRRMTEALPVMTFINDATGRTEYSSPQWWQYAGYPENTDVNEAWATVVHPDDRARATAEYAAALAQKRGWSMEVRLRRHDGQYRWHLSHTVPANTVDGLKWYGSTVDIHEQKRLSQELAASTAHFSQLLEALPHLTWTARPGDGQITYANRSFQRYTGIGAAQLPDLDWRQLIHPADVGGFANLPALLQPGEAVQAEHRLRGTDGTYRWFLASLLPLRDAAGHITQWLGTNTDINDQKRVQQQLRRKDQHLSQILGQAPAILATLEGPDHRYTFFNDSHNELMDKRVVLGEPLAQLLPELQEQGFVALLDQVYQTGETYVGHELPLLPVGALPGQPGRFLDVTFQALRDEQGHISGVLAFAVDTTERVRARQSAGALAVEVSRRDMRLRRMTEALPAVSFICAADGSIEYLSPQWYHYTGQTIELSGKDIFTTLVHPDDQAALRRDLREVFLQGRTWAFEYRLRRHDGEYRWQISRGVPEFDAQGQPLRWYGTMVDNHEQKELQDELRRSEEKFRFMADSTPVIIWTATPAGQIDYCNRPFYDYTGLQPHDLEGPGWLQAVHPDDRAGTAAVWQHSLETGQNYEQQHRLRRYDGLYHWQLVRALPLRDAEGHIVKWYGSSVDVQNQREMQEQLRRSEEQFRFMAESIPQVVWTAQPDGQLDYLNQRWTEWTGMPVEQALRFGWAELVPPDDAAQVVENYVSSFRAGTNYEQESRLLTVQDGRYRWFLHRGTPMRNAQGQVVKWFGTSTDIDDFKQVQQQLEARNEQLARTNADLDNFVYTASHDLKQPINNMAGIFEELTRTAYFRDPDAIKLITMFERALQQIHQTIHDLSDVVQLQRRHAQVPAEEVALEPLIQEILGSMQEQSVALGARFELDFRAVPTVRFVRANLQSVLYNLLSNSLKYADPGRPPRVQVRTSLEGGTPVLTVTDNGQGIDLERHGKELFQLFRRFHEHVEGSGMGLYLVNRMVQLNGAWLKVDSEVGVGSTFRIYCRG